MKSLVDRLRAIKDMDEKIQPLKKVTNFLVLCPEKADHLFNPIYFGPTKKKVAVVNLKKDMIPKELWY